MQDSTSNNYESEHSHHVVNRHMLTFICIFVIGAVLGGAFSPWSFVSKQQKTITTFTVTGVGVGESDPDTVTLNAVSANKQFASEGEANTHAKTITDEIRKKLAPFKLSATSLQIYPSVYSAYTDKVYSQTQGESPIPVELSPMPTLREIPVKDTTSLYNASVSVNIILKREQQKEVTSISGVLKSLDYLDAPADPQYTAPLTQAMQSQARERALQDARNQAEQIAQINKLNVGKIVKIKDKTSELSGGYIPPLDAPVIVNLGEQKAKYTVTYEVVYEMH